MQLEIRTEGVDFVVSRAPLPKNDNDGRQKTDRETGAPLHVTELVAMDDMSVYLGRCRSCVVPLLAVVAVSEDFRGDGPFLEVPEAQL